ncbi:MAG: SHOCT domain-containing protein [Lachnospiraceae bacterium]|nr:SHOCT domain-containing protein [Lachnospiraceae bacterium]
MAGGISGKISLEYLIEQALRIPKVKVDREEFLKGAFAKEGILVRQIVEEGPVACDYSDIELDDMAEKLILRRTSESSAMSFAAGIPGGLAIAATIPADTLQFFAMSLRMAQELAYLYGAKDFWACEGEDGTLVRYQLICSLGAMFGVEGSSAATRLLSSHLAMRAVGGTPQRATTRAFWDPIVKKISKELTLRLTTDTASKGVAKLIPVIGGFFSGGMTFFAMRPMGKKLYDVLSTAAFRYSDSYAMKDYLALEDLVAKAEAEAMFEDDNAPAATGDVAADGGWGPMPGTTGDASAKSAENAPAPADEKGDTAIPISFGDSDNNAGSVPVGGAPADGKPADGDKKEAAGDAAPAESKPAAQEAAPAPATPAPMTMDEVFATIEKLATLRDKGAITQEDFDAKKAELLARI